MLGAGVSHAGYGHAPTRSTNASVPPGARRWEAVRTKSARSLKWYAQSKASTVSYVSTLFFSHATASAHHIVARSPRRWRACCACAASKVTPCKQAGLYVSAKRSSESPHPCPTSRMRASGGMWAAWCRSSASAATREGERAYLDMRRETTRPAASTGPYSSTACAVASHSAQDARWTRTRHASWQAWWKEFTSRSTLCTSRRRLGSIIRPRGRYGFAADIAREKQTMPLAGCGDGRCAKCHPDPPCGPQFAVPASWSRGIRTRH